MRNVTTATTNSWESQVKGGTGNRPIVRATISRLRALGFPYDLARCRGTRHTGTGHFLSAVFGQASQPVELPNIAEVEWKRSVLTDAGTLTMTLWNTEILPIGTTPDYYEVQQLDVAGFFSPDRGGVASYDLWNQIPNGWRNLIVPDSIIKTYEGYGYDATKIPEEDPNLYQSGVWWIDEVVIGDDGLIKVTARDLGRLFLDQIALPPTIPFGRYPLSFEAFNKQKNPLKPSTKVGWFTPKYYTDSNIPYIGKGFSDGPRAYVQKDGGVLGHKGAHAFDASKSTYWLSVGDDQQWRSAYEYIEGTFSARTVSAVKVDAWAGPYTIYISVYADGQWHGTAKVPWRQRVVETHADIPFVTRDRVEKNGTQVVTFKPIANATHVRVSFSDLYDTGIGRYQYRAGCRLVQVQGSTTTMVANGYTEFGDYGDYTDLVKWACVWGGLYWPATAVQGAWIRYSDNTKHNVVPSPPRDGLFPPPAGRAWGDFQQTGTAGIAKLDETLYDKQPLMNIINGVRDTIGFVFYIDEYGGAIWRSPNIWSIGNWVSNVGGGSNTGRTSTVLVLDEEVALLKLGVTLSSKDVRDQIFVSNVAGGLAATANGYNPNPTNIVRAGGWTDQRFETQAECQQMADLIAIQQVFAYHTNMVTIAGHPGIQIDDQVKIQERVTSEVNLHYVTSIDMKWTAMTGRYSMDLETHWLGSNPFNDWSFQPRKAAASTQAYLKKQGHI